MEISKKTTIPDLYCKAGRHGQAGFTIAELIMVLVIFSILAAIALPGYLSWLPNYRLKSAARDLVSNMRKARMQAVKENGNIVVRFDDSINPGFYYFDTNNDAAFTAGENRIDFSTYKSGVDYGTGNAASNWKGNNCTQPTSITYNSRGSSNTGTIYIHNQDNDICYALSISPTGSTKLRKYNGCLPFNKNNWN